MTPQVSCALVERWISQALDGELPGASAIELDRHLDSCAACRELQQRAVQQQQLLDRGLERLSGDLGLLVEARVSDEQIVALDAEEQMRSAASPPSARRTLGGVMRAAALLAFVSLLGSAVWWGAQQFRAAPPRILAQLETPAGVTVAVVEPSGATREVVASAVHDGEELIVTGTGFALLTYPRGTLVRLTPGTRFTMREDMGNDAFHLLAGSAHFEVTRSNRSYLVRTPVAIVSVLGTSFEVEHRPDVRRHLGDGETRVSVISGEVQISRPQSGRAPVSLKAGKRVQVNGQSMQFAEQPNPPAPARPLHIAPPNVTPPAVQSEGPPLRAAEDPSTERPPRASPEQILDAPAKRGEEPKRQ